MTLIYRMRDHFTVNNIDEITGLKVTLASLNKAVAPNNIIVGEGVRKIVVSDTPPVSPQEGDLWIDIS